MSRMICMLLVAALAGCSNAPGSDGNSDGAGIGDFAMKNATKLCTTPSCAKFPCASGCAFGAVCSGALSVEIDAAAAKGCSKFCGLFAETPYGEYGLGCGLYHGDFPGCETCGFRWGASSCVVVDPMLDYQRGGAICNDTCFDGRAPADASPNCSDHDMFPQRWDLSM